MRLLAIRSSWGVEPIHVDIQFAGHCFFESSLKLRVDHLKSLLLGRLRLRLIVPDFIALQSCQDIKNPVDFMCVDMVLRHQHGASPDKLLKIVLGIQCGKPVVPQSDVSLKMDPCC